MTRAIPVKGQKKQKPEYKKRISRASEIKKQLIIHLNEIIKRSEKEPLFLMGGEAMEIFIQLSDAQIECRHEFLAFLELKHLECPIEPN